MSDSKKKVIGFWKVSQANGWMSQWWMSDFTVDGVVYNCCEQYMMAKKAELFGDDVVRGKIMSCRAPFKMRHLGREVSGFDTKTWSAVCLGIVEEANYAKFSQNSKLRKYLLETGDATLVEASLFDKIWGIGITIKHDDFGNPSKWRGKNLLGKALMNVRSRLSSS